MTIKELIEERLKEKAAVNEVYHGISMNEEVKRDFVKKAEDISESMLNAQFDMIGELAIRRIREDDIGDLSSESVPGESYEIDDDDSDIIEQMMALE